MSNQQNLSEIPVLHAENKNKGKKKRIMEFLPVVIIAAILIIAIIVTISIVKSKKSTANEKTDTTQTTNTETEKSNDFVVPSEDQNQEEVTTTPVTFMEDVEISFEGLSTEFSEMMSEHAFTSAAPVATKPEIKQTTTSYNPVQKPTKPQITTKQHLEATTVVTTEEANQDEDVLSVINSFFSRVYYFDGQMISGTESTPLEIAMNNDDFQVFSEIDGMDISFLMQGKKMYMLNPGTKKYTEFSATVQKMFGIDSSEFSFEFNNAEFDGYKPTSVTKAVFKEQDAVCYTYQNNEGKMEFICIDNEIKQLTVYDAEENASTVLVADEFSSQIPEEMLNFQGYSKTNIISFMSSMM